MNYKSLLRELSKASMANDNVDTILVPSNKQLYNIDLNTREVQAPEMLSIQSEHYAETVYFLVDRHYDNMDLAQTNCVIQYAVGDKSYLYAVPFCDTTTYYNEDKIIIPWTVSISATQDAGTVKFFLRFYLIDDSNIYDENNEYHPENVEFSYSLNTLPATTKVKKTLPIEDVENSEKDFSIPDRYFTDVDYLNTLVQNATVYWEDV